VSSQDFPPAVPFDLVLAAGSGSAGASSETQREVMLLFDACAPGLRRYVRSCGLSADAADDVVQDAFVALYRHLCLGGSRSNLRGWLVQVSYRGALKQRERQSRRDRRETPWTREHIEALVDPAIDPEARLSQDQHVRRLRAVVKALPGRDQQCLYLRAEGLPYRDIARTLNLSLGTVAKSLARAAARLSRALNA
jgi:RNA polymerase sigma-70 factor (ECF subfamily)